MTLYARRLYFIGTNRAKKRKYLSFSRSSKVEHNNVIRFFPCFLYYFPRQNSQFLFSARGMDTISKRKRVHLVRSIIKSRQSFGKIVKLDGYERMNILKLMECNLLSKIYSIWRYYRLDISKGKKVNERMLD